MCDIEIVIAAETQNEEKLIELLETRRELINGRGYVSPYFSLFHFICHFNFNCCFRKRILFFYSLQSGDIEIY